MKNTRFPKKFWVRTLRAIIVVLTIGILISSGVVSAQETKPTTPVPEMDGFINLAGTRPPKDANPKLDSPINQLIELNNKKGLFETQSFAEANGMVLDGEKVQVVLVSTPDSIEGLTAEIENLGGSIQANYEGYLQALLPIDAVQEMANQSDVQRIRMPNRPIPSSPMQVVDILSEGLAASNAPAWQSIGYDGTGVRVAVIDVGFTGYTSLLGSELPITSTVTIYDWTGTGMGGDEHGTANAEIVYDMAPGVTMDLHKIDTGVELGQAVTQAISDGVDIITMSLSWTLDGPGDGTGFLNGHRQ